MHYDDGRYSPVAGSWHDVTGVYDAAGATTALYVDGVPEDVEHVFGLPAASGPLTVGAGLLDYAPTDTFRRLDRRAPDVCSRAQPTRSGSCRQTVTSRGFRPQPLAGCRIPVVKVELPLHIPCVVAS